MLKVVKNVETRKVELFGEVYEVQVPSSKHAHNHGVCIDEKPNYVVKSTVEILSDCGLPEKELWELKLDQLLEIYNYLVGDITKKK